MEATPIKEPFIPAYRPLTPSLSTILAMASHVEV